MNETTDTTTDRLISSWNFHETIKRTLSKKHSKTKTKRLEVLKKYFRLKQGKVAKDKAHSVELCAFIAWTGAIVVTLMILRSLYFMYLIPDDIDC